MVKDWVNGVIKHQEHEKYLDQGKDFIDENRIWSQIEAGKSADPSEIRDILQKSLDITTLDPIETAKLIAVEDPELLEEMKHTAKAVKQKVYDNRIVTFAPLYLSNHCVNACTYCGFREANNFMARRQLTMEEIERETEALTGQFGHKRLIVAYGEHPKSDIDYIEKSIDTIYNVQVPTKRGHANIRRVNVNAAPMDIEKLKRLRDVGVGTYQVFQETYHPGTFNQVHPRNTLKGDYRWRLYTMHRAMEAGIDDVGIGALFGLYDWRFEVMGLMYHTHELEKHFNKIGPHTISFPRLEEASNAPYIGQSKYHVSDADFLKLVTILRLSVPYTGMICTARETAEIRNEAVERGITQMDASTRIGLGAYSESDGKQIEDEQQFMLGDNRSLEELIVDMADKGHITSFCTAGYRIGRTGEKIMRLLRECHEGSFCKLNAIITFREWLDDFASPEVKEKCEKILAREMTEAEETLPQFMKSFKPIYKKTCNGNRDLYL